MGEDPCAHGVCNYNDLAGVLISQIFEHFRHGTIGPFSQGAVDEIVEASTLRRPAEQERRTIPIEVIGQLTRTTGRFIKRGVEPVDIEQDGVLLIGEIVLDKRKNLILISDIHVA